jgi:hypothetical protein
MAFQVEKIPGGSGAFFKPAEYVDAVAILIEVRRFEAQRPGSTYGPKDTIYADLTVFKDEAALDGGTPELASNSVIDFQVLVSDLEVMVGKATIAKLARAKPNGGHKPAWVWREVDASVQEKVVAYATARDEALAAAMADAPEFD